MKKQTVFLDLGKEYYRPVWEKQTELLNEARERKMRNEEVVDHLLFVEHPHVYTLGKSGDEANMLINAIQLQAKDAEFVKVDRGGDITYHGPGQLVVYPIFDLQGFNIGVREYVDRLENIVIAALKTWGIKGEKSVGATGVWLDVDGKSPRKICAIGIKCSRYITMHGFALNVNTDLNYFNYINPCGFVDKGVTSIARELGGEISMESVKAEVKKQFIEVFNLDLHK